MLKIINAVVDDRNQDIRHIRHLPILIEGVTSALKEYLQNSLPTEDFSKTEVWGEVIDEPPNRHGSKGYHILNLSLSLVKLIPSRHQGIQNHMSKRKNLSKEKIDDSTDNDDSSDNEDDSSDNEDDSSDNEDESSLDQGTIISSWLPFLI
jgi:cobalamin biosynthesis protein CobT